LRKGRKIAILIKEALKLCLQRIGKGRRNMFVQSPKFWSVVLTSTLAVATFNSNLSAGTVVDLSSANAPSGTINGGIFVQVSEGSGTGIFPAFVQVGGSGQETVRDAYNTTVNNTLFNGSSATFNHEIQVSQLTVFNDGKTNYYAFRLDVNENSGGGNEYIVLNELKLYTSPLANQSLTNPDALGVEQYSMQGDGTNAVLLNYEIGKGSGTGDMVFLVPVSNFADASATDFVYLYSKFGDVTKLAPALLVGKEWGTSDGFEEWALAGATVPGFTPGPVPEIPEPSSMLLLAIGAFGMGGYGLKKWRRKSAA
jgi:hypothetical protein